MFWFASRKKSAEPEPSGPEPYVHRLYLRSRAMLLEIFLGGKRADPDTLKKIAAIIHNDEHFESHREEIGNRFPGQLAVLFNLARDNDRLHPPEELRKAILGHIERHETSPFGQHLGLDDLKAIEKLKQSSRLQQQLAYLAQYTPGKWLLEQEIPHVLESRACRLGPGNLCTAEDDSAGPPAIYHKSEDPYVWSRDHGRLRGLCFSGGGIRSATFNLGILQGLAAKNKLRCFDYLSSVSGGGYIHQWLAAWIKRETPDPPLSAASPGLDAVCKRLIPLPENGCFQQHPEPIRWLRRYSNYLTPQKGLLSGDLWVTVAIWMRNTILNQIVLISALFSVLLLPHLFQLHPQVVQLTPLGVAKATAPHELNNWTTSILFVVLLSFIYLLPVHNLAAGLRAACQGTPQDRLSNSGLLLTVVLPFLFASMALSDFGFYFALPGITPHAQIVGLLIFTFLGVLILNLALTWAGGAYRSGAASERSTLFRVLGFSLAAILASTVCAGCMLVAHRAFLSESVHTFAEHAARSAVSHPALTVLSPPSRDSAEPHLFQETDIRWRLVITFGPLVVISISFIGVILHSGLVGNCLEDWVLEWLGRARGWITLYSLLYTGFVGISLFGHQIMHYLFRPETYDWIKWSALGSWVLTTIGGVLSGKSNSTSGDAHTSNSPFILRLFVILGPAVYIFGLLLILSWLVSEILFTAQQFDPAYGVLIVAVLAVAVFLLFGWRVDINEFSMHSYYRNRLARCYLGASNTARNADPLTGFDPRDIDGMRISKFQPREGYTGPLPIFCAALNISTGEDLAWQERKAASFAFSPILSGYYVPWTGSRYRGQLSYNGFVPTEHFADPEGGIHISTAAAVSGAAISPNWGYHTNPTMAFLLTMFNVRLGWWVENPRRSSLAFDPSGRDPRRSVAAPRFAPLQLACELFGQVGDDSNFVYLTDGGHFDNMGLYELVRRRCYEIVICDAEQDQGPVFEGIGMAIRKCRIDFGVEIDLDLTKLALDDKTGLSTVHWVVGSIRYPETDDAKPGTILYIKSSITGNEPGDVYNYRLQHKAFPQDSTANQWFTESQFESYRRLGQRVVNQCPYL
ncbi:MAG TPA: hypothetical protein VG893_00585 [Terracidiphilus sp.]|nr:hypothetical protein [Terracidiphilus sp.]